MALRIATWNMDHWKRMRDDPSGQAQRDAWAYLTSLNVDVALVQEAVPPPFVDPSSWPVRSHPAPDRPDEWFMHPRYRRWGSAVVVFNPQLEFEPVESAQLNGFRLPTALWVSHPGSWSAIKITKADQPPITLVSAYGAWDIATADGKSSYYQTTVHRILSDLTPLLESDDGQRTVLAGDLNVGTQSNHPTDEEPYRSRPTSRALFDRFASLGLVECIGAGLPADRGPLARCTCGPAPDCRHVQTYRHDNKPDGMPWQNDYFFAGSALAGALTSCVVVDDEATWALSDHSPVVAEFDV